MDRGDVQYDIVEVMACPGGCIGGGGQPLPNQAPQRQMRNRGLRTADRRQQIRLAHDNVLIRDVYEQWLGEPNGEEAHHLLHTSFNQRER
jgi:iron only hydrogenase large subunit-like protein